MQSLCLLLAAACLALPGPSWAQAKPVPASAQAKWPAAATPELALSQAVIQWLSATQGLDAAGLRLTPLDPRLQIKPCQAGLQLDLPFASQETVRVRCKTPVWQLFVRVQPDSPALAARTASPQPDAGPAPATRKVVVANGLLQRGTRLSAAQLSLVDLPASGLPFNAIDRVADAVNAELVRDVPSGAPVRSQDIRPALMVKKGQMVMLSAGRASGFSIQARLEAMQDGRLGEQIKLKNKESGRQISAVVTGLNAADAL